jgi:hypothetical protein
MVALAYVCMGDKQAAGEYLRGYYSYMGGKADRLADAVIADKNRLRAVVHGYADAGCDELLLFACKDDPTQVDRIADVVRP